MYANRRRTLVATLAVATLSLTSGRQVCAGDDAAAIDFTYSTSALLSNSARFIDVNVSTERPAAQFEIPIARCVSNAFKAFLAAKGKFTPSSAAAESLNHDELSDALRTCPLATPFVVYSDSIEMRIDCSPKARPMLSIFTGPRKPTEVEQLVADGFPSSERGYWFKHRPPVLIHGIPAHIRRPTPPLEHELVVTDGLAIWIADEGSNNGRSSGSASGATIESAPIEETISKRFPASERDSKRTIERGRPRSALLTPEDAVGGLSERPKKRDYAAMDGIGMRFVDEGATVYR